MNPFRQKIDQLVESAKAHHACERDASLASVDLVRALLRANAACYLVVSSEELAKRIGLSPNQFWKRATVTNLALVAPRLTPANAKYFLERMRYKRVGEVKKLVGRVAPDGTSLISKPRRTLEDQIDQALKIATSRGRSLTRDNLLSEAIGYWLDEWSAAPSLEKDA